MNSDSLSSNKIWSVGDKTAVVVMLIPIGHMAVHPLLSDAMDCLGVVAPPCMHIYKLAVNELVPSNALIQEVRSTGQGTVVVLLHRAFLLDHGGINIRCPHLQRRC